MSNEPENFIGGKQILWLSRDNTLDFILKEDGVAADLSSVTKIVLDFNGTDQISDEVAGDYPIRWLFDPVVQGKVSLQLGTDSATPTELERYYNAKLILYDNINDDGITWGEIPLFSK